MLDTDFAKFYSGPYDTPMCCMVQGLSNITNSAIPDCVHYCGHSIVLSNKLTSSPRLTIVTPNPCSFGMAELLESAKGMIPQ
jgi:hypothetical protein